MEPKRITLEPSPAGSGVKAPEYPCISRMEMQQTAMGGCRHDDGRAGQEGSMFLQITIGVKPDKPTQFAARLKVVILPTSWQHKER